MRLRPTAVIVAALASFVTVLPAAAAPTQVPRETLRGTVTPEATIFLRHADGRNVTQLDAGLYQIVVEDQSIEHNFHLSGAGVNMATSVENIETVTWNVTFADAQRYTFVCDPHSTTMRGTFNVGNVPPPPPPPPVRRLTASVTARAISVRTASGRRARSVAAGRYRIAVRDSARTQNFHLIGPGVNRKTTVRGTSRPTWTLTLRRGKYTYRSDANRRLRGTFTAR
jgi:Copper binding proteins, plastocyanin/azurin family